MIKVTKATLLPDKETVRVEMVDYDVHGTDPKKSADMGPYDVSVNDFVDWDSWKTSCHRFIRSIEKQDASFDSGYLNRQSWEYWQDQIKAEFDKS